MSVMADGIARRTMLGITLGALWTAPAPVSAEVELLGETTPWRVWMVMGKRAEGGPDGAGGSHRQFKKTVGTERVNVTEFVAFTAENAELTSLPPGDWMGAQYEDSLWGRYEGDLGEWIGLYTGMRERRAGHEPAVVYLRTRFGIADPVRAADLKLTIEYVGGVAAYVNGKEVGRGHLPPGPLQPYTTAPGYPMETYTLEDGVSHVPVVRWGVEHTLEALPRVRQRVRTSSVTVPAHALVKGANVLALEVHRAPVPPDVPGPEGGRYVWRHQGIGAVCLRSASGDGVIAWGEALKGTRVWSAQPLEQVSNQRAEKILADWGRPPGAPGFMTFGLVRGNPFDPLLPVRILVPRNGVGNGQTVLTDEAGLAGVTASVGAITGPGGAALPGVRILYGKQEGLESSHKLSTRHWCDHLVGQPPEGAKTIPVWIEVSAPKGQTPGWYTGELLLTANGRRFTVPVQVFVTGFTAPDPQDFRSVIIAIHSPEATAKQYNLRPYSEEHFRMMEKSLAFMGQIGGDLMTVPVIKDGNMNHETGLIRWVKTEAGLKPDFSLFEKYLDTYVKHCGRPKAVTLRVWSVETANEAATAYEHHQFPTRKVTPKWPLKVTCWDPKTGETEDVEAPTFLAQGAEAFWKPMLDGVHDIVVKKRGWPEQTILLGVGSDARPSVRTGELFRKWAPYARWEILSHFSGDPGGFYSGPPLPGSARGKFIALGNLEVGLKEMAGGDGLSARSLEALVQSRNEYLTTWLHREGPAMYSSPIMYRTVPMSGHWTRVGMDYWPKVSGRSGPGYFIWGEQPIWLTWPGPDGPMPTVRLQMIREGLQDFEARWTIAKRIVSLPEEQRQPDRKLLNDLFGYVGFYLGVNPVYLLPHTAPSFDWYAYVARLHAAAELAGAKSDAAWDRPPR
jgi:hypothetical protein